MGGRGERMRGNGRKREEKKDLAFPTKLVIAA